MEHSSLYKREIENIDIFAKEGFWAVVKKGDKADYQITLENPEKVNAPTKEGDVVGKVIVSKDGNVIQEIELIVKTNIEKLSLKDCVDKIVHTW